MVDEAKLAIESVVVPKATGIMEDNKLDPLFMASVKWDILCCIMYATYESYNPPPFIGDISHIYSCGHFPCGWKGLWPEGRLVIY